MIPLAVLLISWLVFRAAGALGVPTFHTWRDSARWALALMLLFTASAHFTAMRHDLEKMLPAWVPQPAAVIFLTGIFEIAAAIGLLIPRTRRPAGIALCALLIAMFPANIKAAQEALTIGGNPATALWLRVPMQILFIWLAWWSTAPTQPTATR